MKHHAFSLSELMVQNLVANWKESNVMHSTNATL